MNVRKRLEKYYDVDDFDWGESLFYNKVQRLFKHFFNIYIDFNAYLTKKFHDKYGYNNIIFAYDNTPLNYSKNNIYFVYQDFTWHFLNHIFETNKKLWNVNFKDDFQMVRMKKLLKNQNEFYKNDNVHCLTMSRWLAKYLVEKQSIPENRVHYVGGGINLNCSKRDFSRKKGNKFLFVGKDFDRKNGPLVVEAFKKIYAEDEKNELYIAGPENLNTDCKGIHLLGKLSFEQVLEYFNLCDVFVMPSLFEGYGLVFCEALAFGLPCIGNNCFEMPYFIEEGINGYILKNQNSDELALIMKKAINNENMKNYVIQHCDDYLNEYSWDTIVNRIVNVIENNTK